MMMPPLVFASSTTVRYDTQLVRLKPSTDTPTQTFNTCNTHCKAFPQKMPKNVCRKVAARADDGTAKRDAQGESIIPWQEEEDDDDEHEKRQCVGFLPGLPCHKPHSSTTMTSALTTSTPDSQPEKRQCHPMPGGPCDKPNSSTTTPQPAPSPDNKVKKSPPGPDCVPFPGAACDKPNSSTTTSQSAATTDNKAEKRQPDRCNLMPGGACNTNADQ